MTFSNKKFDPDLKLISFNKKGFRSENEEGISYERDVTVSFARVPSP